LFLFDPENAELFIGENIVNGGLDFNRLKNVLLLKLLVPRF